MRALSVTGSMRLMTVRVCVVAVCVRHGPRYTVSSWSECSKACGYGLQYRAVGCATVRALVVTAVMVAVVAGSRTAPLFAHLPLFSLPAHLSPLLQLVGASLPLSKCTDGLTEAPPASTQSCLGTFCNVYVCIVYCVYHVIGSSLWLPGYSQTLAFHKFPEWCFSSHCALQPTPWTWWCCCFVLGVFFFPFCLSLFSPLS